MKEYQTIFLNLALDAKALEFGSFTLKSGRTSPYFFNAAKMLNGDLYKLAKCYQEAIDDSNISFDCIYGPAYKGIFLGSIVAMIFNQEGKNYPLSFNRKEIKDHGEGGNIIGSDPIGDVMIIDDVLSAGTAARESIELIKNKDILESVCKLRNKPICIGFAAETENFLANAKAKLKNKRCDAIILNDISSSEIGLNSDENEVHFISQEKTEKIDRSSKQIIAEKIIKKVTKYFF